MTINGFDVDSLNKPISFARAASQGYRTCYIKLGGDNVGRYVMSSNGGYSGQMGQAVSAGFVNRGAYWVTGGYDPAASARFYLTNRHPRTTFDVLDNEKLDSGRVWSPAEAYTFLKALHDVGLRDLWMYASRLGPWAEDDYTRLASLGVKAIVADYSTGQLGSRIFTINYPNSLIKGHQWSSSATVGGYGNVDVDAFTDDAFTPHAAAVSTNRRRHDMLNIMHIPANGTDRKYHHFGLFGPGFFHEWDGTPGGNGGQSEANGFAQQAGSNSAPVTIAEFEAIKAACASATVVAGGVAAPANLNINLSGTAVQA